MISGTPTERRADIQGIRSVAVLAVVLFHVWPDLFAGGYVGVDVFFVISGYLITGLLLRELASAGTIDLTGFFLRRAARLLPAALFVLCCILIALPLLPEPRWGETLRELSASALYVQNWYLAILSVDYLGAESAASPLRHYWSLAVEEQFYLLWPLFLMLSTVLLNSALPMDRQRLLILALLSIGIPSLWYSVAATNASPEAAYFSTFTRVWEFVAGALLAAGLLREPARGWSIFSGAVGLLLIVGSVLLMSGDTRFPGYAAIAPVAGTVLLIWSGSGTQASYGFSMLKSPPVVALGNISYSVYLWHWPLIVWYRGVDSEPLSLPEGLLLIAVSVLLAVLTYRFIEERFRLRRKPEAAGSKLVLALSSSALLAVVALTLNAHWRDAEGPLPESTAVAGSLVASDSLRDHSLIVPSLRAAKEDLPEIYRSGCHAAKEVVEPSGCSFGDTSSDVTIALVGDSHAANWMPALHRLAEERQWHLRVYTKSACPFIVQQVLLKGVPYQECAEWNRRLLRVLAELHVQAVFTSQSTATRVRVPSGAGGGRDVVSALRSSWSSLLEVVPRVIAIRDTPRMPFDPPDCVSAGRRCLAPAGDAVSEADPIVLAALEAEANLRLVDMTSYFCENDWCFSMAGNVLIWRDYHHLTATYSSLLGRPLGAQPAVQALTVELGVQ